MRLTALLVTSLLLTPFEAVAKAPREMSYAEIPQALQRFVAVHAPIVALVDINIIDGAGSAPRFHHTVIMQNGRIVRLGPVSDVAIPEDAVVLKLSGRTVIPGLVGMHNHTHMPGVHLQAFTAPRLYLASGVTTIQTTGSADAHGEMKLAQAIVDGELPGPRIFATAPYVTGPGGNASMFIPADEAEARAFVDRWANAGATWIKLYRHVVPSIAATIIDAAHLRGLKVTGHLCSLTYSEAALMGIDSIEHGLLPISDFVSDKPAGQCERNAASIGDLDLNSEPVADLISLLIANDVTLTSTLAIMESHFPHRPQGDDRSLSVMSPDLVDAYRQRQSRLRETAATTRYRPELWEKILSFERFFADAGGQLVAGPDIGRHVLPGFGDQRNFELLVESGFTVPEAVKIMTLNGARALGIDEETGRISEGYLADIVVLNGDLTVYPSVIRDVELVFKQGTGFDPKSLLKHVDGRVGID